MALNKHCKSSTMKCIGELIHFQTPDLRVSYVLSRCQYGHHQCHDIWRESDLKNMRSREWIPLSYQETLTAKAQTWWKKWGSMPSDWKIVLTRMLRKILFSLIARELSAVTILSSKKKILITLFLIFFFWGLVKDIVYYGKVQNAVELHDNC